MNAASQKELMLDPNLNYLSPEVYIIKVKKFWWTAVLQVWMLLRTLKWYNMDAAVHKTPLSCCRCGLELLLSPAKRFAQSAR